MCESTEELHQMTLARGKIYKFLSFIFLKEPSKDVIEKLKDREFLSNLKELFGHSSSHLEKFLKEFDGNCKALKQEYVSLFLAPSARYVAPYESVYRTGLLWGNSTIDVLKCYERAGVVISKECKEIPDHLGLELEFIHFLCGREAETLENSREEALKFLNLQKEFLQNHLMSWVSEVCDEIEKKTKSEFYKGIASLTSEFVKRDFRELCETKTF
ncbi:MAG: molecular chaperone [Candidatus Methanofastidiosia archaeon]